MRILNRLPLMAFGLGLGLIVAMSSFKREIKKENIKEELLHWYSVNNATNQTTALVSVLGPQTKSESLPSGLSPLTSCKDETSPICLVGFKIPQPIGTAVGSPLPDYSINRSL